MPGIRFDQEIVDAVIAHNHAHGKPRNTLMAKALYAADPLTGLIVASALISPAKKLSAIDTKFVLNRMAEKSLPGVPIGNHPVLYRNGIIS